MKAVYSIEPIKFNTIAELPQGWIPQDYVELLEAMDFEDIAGIAPEELKEMCLMSLTDNEPEDAAKIVMKFRLGSRLNAGQIDNLSNEMRDEKMWEEYADLSLHEDFFNVSQLLYEAYNGKFPNPEAVRFQLKIKVSNPADLLVFEQDAEASLIRLLAAGMPENTLIRRLFEEQLEGGMFGEASDIIWQLHKEERTSDSVTFTIISSLYWFRDFKYVMPYEAALEKEV